jgi:hypothetical protein
MAGRLLAGDLDVRHLPYAALTTYAPLVLLERGSRPGVSPVEVAGALSQGAPSSNGHPAAAVA